MAEQRKLPFVWELNREGVISHSVGLIHFLPEDVSFADDIRKYMTGKKHILMEDADVQPSEIYYPGNKAMEVCIEKLANSLGIPTNQIESMVQKLWARHIVDKLSGKIDQTKYSPSETDDAYEAYIAGDETTFRKVSDDNDKIAKSILTPEEFSGIKNRSKNMAESSLSWLSTGAPCFITAGIFHFTESQSVLDYYRQHGIQVRRVQ